MKLLKFKHENVLPNGTFSNRPGQVLTKGGIRMSEQNGGCNLENCNCSPGYWITVTNPITPDGIIEGTTVTFEDKEEMIRFIQNVFAAV